MSINPLTCCSRLHKDQNRRLAWSSRCHWGKQKEKKGGSWLKFYECFGFSNFQFKLTSHSGWPPYPQPPRACASSQMSALPYTTGKCWWNWWQVVQTTAWQSVQTWHCYSRETHKKKAISSRPQWEEQWKERTKKERKKEKKWKKEKKDLKS